MQPLLSSGVHLSTCPFTLERRKRQSLLKIFFGFLQTSFNIFQRIQPYLSLNSSPRPHNCITFKAAQLGFNNIQTQLKLNNKIELFLRLNTTTVAGRIMKNNKN